MKSSQVRNWALALFVSLLPAAGAAQQPVQLTVGYQPYDTISYSAVVIRGLNP